VLTLEEIVDLQQQSLSVSFDAYPTHVTLGKLDQKLIEQFFDRVNNRGRVALRDDLLTNLVKLKLIRDDNAVVHRDYKNFSDIIIKIFDDRILFTNPGRLYGQLCLADLERDDYVSSLRNRLLAEAFYLTGDIERYGTGFVRIRDFLEDYPEVTLFVEERGDFFKAELRINDLSSPQVTGQVTGQVTEQVTEQVSDNVNKLLVACFGELRSELQKKLTLKHRDSFNENYLKPALESGFIEMTIPDKPRSSKQKYRLTEKGKKVVDS
jgi:ATP-dependent DNA helicase RecG